MSTPEQDLFAISQALLKSFAKARDEARAECRFVVRITVDEPEGELTVGTFGPFADEGEAENWSRIRQKEIATLNEKYCDKSSLRPDAIYHIESIGNPFDILDPELRHKIWTK